MNELKTGGQADPVIAPIRTVVEYRLFLASKSSLLEKVILKFIVRPSKFGGGAEVKTFAHVELSSWSGHIVLQMRISQDNNAFL